jgi:PAS domain S-box-containing protein
MWVAALCVATYVLSAIAINQGWFVPIVAADLTDVKPLFTEGGTFLLVVIGSTLVLRWSTRGFFASLSEARHEAAKNQAILQGIADAVLVFDSKWNVTVANPAAHELARWHAGEIVGRDVESLMDAGGVPLDAAGWSVLRDMVRSGEPTRFEWGDKTLSASVSWVRDPSGDVTGSVAVLRDVTEQVEVERARESLFAVAAHELRTPLNAIINFASMMQSSLLPPDRMQSTTRRIVINGERLLILVNNLLERARMEAGQAHLRIEPFAVAKLIDSVLGTMEVLAEEKGLGLSAQIADEVPKTLLGDQQRLYQVLINLVSNGIKFTEKGEVRVRAFLSDEDGWALEVSDTGAGISMETQERIFEPFELAEDPVTRRQVGAGLGLSIVKRMVELMGGQIALESEVGQGSTFTVELPLVPGETNVA